MMANQLVALPASCQTLVGLIDFTELIYKVQINLIQTAVDSVDSDYILSHSVL